MGKKSRKKGGEDKVSRKEKLQERRDRVEEQLATNTATAQHDDTTIAINEHTLLEGDIVWFDKEEYEHYNDDSDPNEYRGIVHKVSPSVCKVQPLSNIFRNDSSCVDIDRAAHYIRRHMNTNWTTRLDVGDKVVCYAKRGWVSGTVKNLWPIWARQGNTSDFEVPAYNILCSDLQKVAAPEDEDYCVMQHPEKFRFKVGDKIILNCRKAVTGKTVPSTGMHWVPGLVTRVDFVNTNADAYAAYLCTTEVAPEVCVVSDDDEHICAEDAKPRDRLLESIDQDCSYDHIDFLVKSYDIDVIPIRDMLFRRAMEQGSFHALRWLEENADLPMWKPRFANGNTILHQMATSPFAQRFLRGFHSYSRDSSAKDTSLTEFKYRNSGEESCHLVTNLSGETWLEVLVKSNNIKAIQFALTLRDGLFGSLLIASFRLEQEILEKLVMIAHNNSVKKIMVDQFTRNCALFAQISALAFISRSLYGKESDFLIKNQCMTSFRGDGAIESATRLIRFVRQWQDESWCRIFKISNVLEQVIKAGE